MLREFQPEDLPRIKELFSRQGFTYEEPDFTGQNFIAGVVLDQGGKIVDAVFARRTVELYLISDKKWGTPGLRWDALKQVHEAMRRILDKLGYDDAHLWCPPELEKSFGRRLVRKLNWVRSTWPVFVKGTRV